MRISPITATVIIFLFLCAAYWVYSAGILTAIFAKADLFGLALFGTFGGLAVTGILIFAIKSAATNRRK